MLRHLILTVYITSPLILWSQDKPLDMKMDFEEYDPSIIISGGGASVIES